MVNRRGDPETTAAPGTVVVLIFFRRRAHRPFCCHWNDKISGQRRFCGGRMMSPLVSWIVRHLYEVAMVKRTPYRNNEPFLPTTFKYPRLIKGGSLQCPSLSLIRFPYETGFPWVFLIKDFNGIVINTYPTHAF